MPRRSWDTVSKRAAKQEPRILCDGGVTYVDCPRIDVLYKYRWWWVRLNPRLLFPAFRRDHRKLIVINGKKRGTAEIRSGLIPLSRFELPGSGLGVALQRFVRKYLGLGLKRYERGYIYITIGKYRYVVVQHTSKEGLHICEVYDKRTEQQVGNFMFSQDFTEVYPHTVYEGAANVLFVIMGYVADSMVYSRAAGLLQKIIKVKV